VVHSPAVVRSSAEAVENRCSQSAVAFESHDFHGEEDPSLVTGLGVDPSDQASPTGLVLADSLSASFLDPPTFLAVGAWMARKLSRTGSRGID
jgi:hypothetical protein